MSSRKRIAIVHGPNLNLLGQREPGIYGSTSLDELNTRLVSLGQELGVDAVPQQANSEGAIIDFLHDARSGSAGVIINPGGYTHTSVAIHDAIRAIEIPVIEVHLSNLYKRESIRHNSITGSACAGVIMGLGVNSYYLALHHIVSQLMSSQGNEGGAE